jgi:hypothetical protein
MDKAKAMLTIDHIKRALPNAEAEMLYSTLQQMREEVQHRLLDTGSNPCLDNEP